ncbi:MAG: calcium/sodium antiporter [Phycisphaerae bacterium]
MLAGIIDTVHPTFFTGLSSSVLWGLIIAAILCLVLGADRAVGSAARLAVALGINKVIIGATVVSLGTTLPEACVSVMAAFQGQPGLALGNGIGSVTFNTAMIFGFCGLFAALPKDRFLLDRHGWIQLAAAVLLFAICLAIWAVQGDISQVHLTRPIGLLLVGLLAGYIYKSVRWAKSHPELVNEEMIDEKVMEGEAPKQATGKILTLLVLFAGLALVVAGSELMVGSVQEISLRYNVPQDIIAVTVVALGTSLPELVTGIVSLIKGHSELLVGNVIGANILNILFVVGVSATAADLQVGRAFFWLHMPTMIILLGLVRVFGYTKGPRFRRWHGLPMVAVYGVFVYLAIRFGILG